MTTLRVSDFVSEDPKDVHTYGLDEPERNELADVALLHDVPVYKGIDEKINRIHQYLKVLKFGYGGIVGGRCIATHVGVDAEAQGLLRATQRAVAPLPRWDGWRERAGA